MNCFFPELDTSNATARARSEQADNPPLALPEGDLRTGQEGGIIC